MRIIFLHTFIFSCLLYLSGVSLPPIFTSASREIELDIKATGNSSPSGKGSEVWLYSIQRAGGIIVPWDEIKFEHGWEFRKTLAVSYFAQPSSATWKGSISAPLTIYLRPHPYSGEVKISTIDGRTWTRQLYSRNLEKYITLKIDPPYTAFEKISSNLLFSFLASILLTLLGREKSGEINLNKGAYILGITTLFISGIIYSIAVSRYFNGLPFNGALQFWNPLRRLALGDLPGRDFFSFHGIGQALAFYPFFKLLSGNFLASEFLRQFGTFTLFIISSLFFLRTLGLDKILSLALTAYAVLIPQFNDLALPHETSLGLRTSLPLLLATLCYNLLNKTFINRTIIFSIFGAISMLWSTEQGPVTLVGIIAWILIDNKKGILASIPEITKTLLSSLSLFFFLLFLISKGHAVDILKYIIDINADQKWFFGAPPNPFISNYSNFLTSPVLNSIIYVFIAITIFLVFLFSKNVKPRSDQPLIVFTLISTSVASFLMQTGYTAELYNASAERALYLCLSVYLFRIFPDALKRFIAYPAYLIVLLSPIYLSEQISALRERRLSSNRYTYFPQLGAKLGDYYDNLDVVINSLKSKKISSFHSDYRGFIEELIGSKPTTRFDYIIHALGKEKREEYLELFKNPPGYIQTLKSSHTQYARWLQQEIWPYYETILQNYEPFMETSSSIIWKQRAEKLSNKEVNAITIITPDTNVDTGQLIKDNLPHANTNHWRIDIEYELGTQYFGQELTRHLVNYHPDPNYIAMPISLPPYLNNFSFPIVIKDRNLKLEATSIGLFSGNSDLKIKELRLTPLHYPEISLEAMFEK